MHKNNSSDEEKLIHVNDNDNKPRLYFYEVEGLQRHLMTAIINFSTDSSFQQLQIRTGVYPWECVGDWLVRVQLLSIILNCFAL